MGKKYSDTELDKAYAALCSSGQMYASQLVRLKLNLKGEIAYIDTVNGSGDKTEDKLRVNIPEQTLHYLGGHVGLNDKIYGAIDDNTILFVVPSSAEYDSASDTEFKIAKRGNLYQGNMLIETYADTDKVGCEQYAVLRGFDITPNRTDIPILVNEIVSVVNSDGSIVECLNGYQGSTYVSVEAEDGYSFIADNVKPGDILRPVQNNAGAVTGILPLYNYTDRDSFAPWANFNALYEVMDGYVNDVVDGVLKISYTLCDSVDAVVNTSGVPVLICDINDPRELIRVGSLGDALTYYNAGNDCSAVFVMMTYAAPKMIVIYNK